MDIHINALINVIILTTSFPRVKYLCKHMYRLSDKVNGTKPTIALNFIELHRIALHCTTLHYIALQ